MQAINEAVMTVSIPGLPEPRHGKVREVFDLGKEFLIVSTDRISAFDVNMPNGIPDKGKILNQMSASWFDELSDVCPNHVITTSDIRIMEQIKSTDPQLIGRMTLAKKAKPLVIECVARGYISGSLYKEYRASGQAVHGLNLPEHLSDGDELPEPIFTPATKAQEGHDENLSFEQAVDLVGREVAEQVRDWTLELYSRARAKARECGLILADTKFEFGETDDGLIWIDEALTPDSSRFWEEDSWVENQSLVSLDKQFVRNYLESIGWKKQPPAPVLPSGIVEKTRDKYLEAYRRIVGREFVA